MRQGVIVMDEHGERPATAEEAAEFYRTIAPTDPELCNCGHAGLARGFHHRRCPVTVAT